MLVGMVVPFYGLGNDIPPGFEPCDGRRFTFGQYPLLYNLLIRSGNVDLLKLDPRQDYGSWNKLPNGVIRVPDLRAEFVRGLYTQDPLNDPPKPLKDPSERQRGLGTSQWDGLEAHKHDFSYRVKVHGIKGHRSWDDGPDNNTDLITDSTLIRDLNDSDVVVDGSTFVANETRGRNVALTMIICASERQLVSEHLLTIPTDPRGPIPAEMVEAARQLYPGLRPA